MQNRRVFLATIAAATTSPIAGCSGEPSDTDMNGTATATQDAPSSTEPGSETASETPAESLNLVVTEANWPSERMRIDLDTPIEMVVANRGDSATTLAGELVASPLKTDSDTTPITDAPSETTLTAEFEPTDITVQPGEQVTVTTSEVNPQYAGDYRATVQLPSPDSELLPTAADGSPTLTVDPYTGTLDELTRLTPTVGMQINDVGFHEALHYTVPAQNSDTGYENTADRVSLATPQENTMFATVSAGIVNRGEELFQVPDEYAFRLNGFAPVESALHDSAVDVTDTIRTASIQPQSSVTGDLLFAVTPDDIANSSFSAYRKPQSSVAETQYEIDLSYAGLEDFSLVDTSVPETTGGGDTTDEFTFTVRNDGTRNEGRQLATIQAALEWRDPGATEYTHLLAGNADLEASVPAGETRELFREAPARSETTEYRLLPFNKEFTVRSD